MICVCIVSLLKYVTSSVIQCTYTERSKWLLYKSSYNVYKVIEVLKGEQYEAFEVYERIICIGVGSSINISCIGNYSKGLPRT